MLKTRAQELGQETCT